MLLTIRKPNEKLFCKMDLQTFKQFRQQRREGFDYNDYSHPRWQRLPLLSVFPAALIRMCRYFLIFLLVINGRAENRRGNNEVES